MGMSVRVNADLGGDRAPLHWTFATCSPTLADRPHPGEVLGSGTAGAAGLELDRRLAGGDVVELEIEASGPRNRIATKKEGGHGLRGIGAVEANEGEGTRIARICEEMKTPHGRPGNLFYQSHAHRRTAAFYCKSSTSTRKATRPSGFGALPAARGGRASPQPGVRERASRDDVRRPRGARLTRIVDLSPTVPRAFTARRPPMSAYVSTCARSRAVAILAGEPERAQRGHVESKLP